MANKNTQIYFNRVAINYGKNSRKFLWKKVREIERGAIEPTLRPFPAEKILELRCGDGFYTSMLRKLNPCAKITCVDFSRDMLERNPVPAIRKVHADIEEYETDERFDLVFCAGALEFLVDPFQAAAKFQRNLNPSGKMVLFFPRFSGLGLLYLWFHGFHKNRVKLFRNRDAAILRGNRNILIDKSVFPFNRLILLEAES